MRIAYFDCFAGISGDMTVGALLHAGLDFDAWRAQLRSLPLSGYEIATRKMQKSGITGIHVDITVTDDHPHRHLSDIEEMLDTATELPVSVRERSRAVFRRLGRAEAKVHDIPLEHVHFHEVGAVDSILDVVGAVLGLHMLGIERIEASPLPLTRGFVRAAHGNLPLPAPATLALLAERGVPGRRTDVEGELVTPTGAALLCELADAFGPYPNMIVTGTGYGAGSKDFPFPNLLRVVLGEVNGFGTAEELVLLETNIDDMPGEIFGYAIEALLEAGALDAWLTPIQMKKGRPATLLSTLARPLDAERLTHLILSETSTLGVRRQIITRECLPRETAMVETPYGAVRMKIAYLPDGSVKAAPEYEDCRELARTKRMPLRDVYAAAQAAFTEGANLQSGLQP